MIVNKNKALVKSNSNIDIQPISEENSIFFTRHSNSDYVKSYNLVDIKSGLTKQRNQYYFFDHCIVNTPKTRYSQDDNKIMSYKVYPITNDLANKIIKEKKFSLWEIFFNSFVNYKTVYLMIRNWDLKITQWNAIVQDNYIEIPWAISPSNLKDGETILEFLNSHNKQYKPQEISINKIVMRDNLIKELFIN